jgi:rubrerythrin
MKQSVYDDIIDRAISSEIEAAEFYAQVAEKSKNTFIKELFLTFSEEEKKHRQILEGFRDDPSVAISFEKVPDFHIAETVDQPALSMDMSPVDAVALAMKKEEAAMRHYTELADVCTNAERKKLFYQLAAMEREHKNKMENAFVDIGYPEVW